MRRTESSFSASSSQPAETPRSTFSSFGANLSRVPSVSSRDVALYGLAQGLVPIINDPSVQSHLNSAWCWPWAGGSDSFTTPPAPPHGVLYEVTLQDFRRYMRVMAAKYDRFESNLQNVALDNSRHPSDTPRTGELHGQGEGLAQAMRQVPLQYFTEEFDLTRRETWQGICPSEQEEDRQEIMDQLTGYLDVVETHLLRDIAARSENFFQAAGVVQDLRGVLARSYVQVKALRQNVHSLDDEVLEAAVTIQRLQCRRKNLKELLHKLQVVDHVMQLQDALQLLVPQGDFAGALDIRNDIQATLLRDNLHHLHCFRHLPQQLVQAGEAVQELMVSDLLALLRFQDLPELQDHILAAIVQQQEYNSVGEAPDQADYRIQSDDGGTPEPQHSATSGSGEGLSGVLEAASASLQLQPGQTDDLTEMATSLVLGLRKTGSLQTALKEYKEAAAMEVKQAIRDVVEGTLPELLGMQWPALKQHPLADKLQAISLEAFLQMLAAVLCVTQACLQHCTRARALVEEGLRAGRTPRTQWGPVLDQVQEAAQAITEVAHGRWAKLLGSRTAATNEAQVPELKRLLGLCNQFMAMTDGFGCRPSLAMRNAMHLQCKAYLDHLHHQTLANLTGLLEQETWAIVQVPVAIQLTVDDWTQQAETLKSSRSHSRPSSLPSSRTPSGTGEAESISQEPSRPVSPPHAPQASTSGRPPAPPPALHHANGHQETNMLYVSGQGYHVAHTVLLLVRMQQTYLNFREAVPLLAAETARRAADLLKVFNSRMCQLVLGAGAMQVSGLRSITAKHLALSSQCLSALMALHPLLRALFTSSLPAAQRGLLLPDLDRLLQDLSMHKEEIHSKLVAIMRERLANSLKQLPAVAMSWGSQAPPATAHPPPSTFAHTNAKQLRVLSQVLSPILLATDLHSIFGRVAALFSGALTDAFMRLEPRGMAWEAQCSADIRHLVYTLEQLPMDNSQAAGNVQSLANLYATRFAALPEQATASDSAKPAGSPKSLHRSLTDVDAARRQEHQGASYTQHGLFHAQQAASRVHPSTEHEGHVHTNGVAHANSREAQLHTAEPSAMKPSDAAVHQSNGAFAQVSHGPRLDTAAALPSSTSSEAEAGSSKASDRRRPDAVSETSWGNVSPGQAPVMHSASSPGHQSGVQLQNQEDRLVDSMASQMDETSASDAADTLVQAADPDFATTSADGDIHMLAAHGALSLDTSPVQSTDDRQTESEQLHNQQ